ncbi:TIGR02281 family clan AA aspartic protease [Rhizobiaceae bacterium n13]|uniref:TIGR02281 family clan AA aspartic protease n=1 Tax=Ferirhizobium litorale TaxID=2927786 RepID=A0AAE3U3W5_9HYPH|nr:TIGR02281 family clan AA aspartic protease [Fererhizobium litorale]MDI7864896.1 TIGR02281 family clan AA aspartic protease [Fererhizobium litorale]MDI7925016.1 TIGR02281 family clan AA aspartic protease [Fererhizobium litorale]
MNRLTIVWIILGVGLALLLFNHDDGRTLGLDNDDFGRVVYLMPLAALLGAGVLASRRNLGENLRNLALWVVIILAIATAYLYRNDVGSIGSRLIAGLVPGRAMVVTGGDGDQEVVLYKSMNGHFNVDTRVNGQDIDMLVDTGASMVVLSHRDAERIGIIPENLTYSMRVSTANGTASAAPVRLSSVAIGPIVRRNVTAAVAEQGRLDQSLLGMSFLQTLSSLQMQPDELRLRN